MNFEIIVNNETLDDELIMLNMENLEEEEMVTLLKILSTKGGDNKDAYYKIKDYGKSCGMDSLIEFEP